MLIYKNICVNSLADRIQMFPVAASLSNSIVRMFGASTGSSLIKGWNHQTDSGFLVPSFSLDFLLYHHICEHPCLFLIDVEGSEFSVIQGAANLVRSLTGSVFCLEVSCRAFSPDGLLNPNFLPTFEFFWAEGYQAFVHCQEGLECVSREYILQYSVSGFNGLMVFFSRGFDFP